MGVCIKEVDMRNKWIAVLLMAGMMMPTLIQIGVLEDSVRNTYIGEAINSEVAYININEISTSINIGNGIARVSGSTSAIHLERVETIVQLQQFYDNKWKTLDTWSSKEEYFSMKSQYY